MQRTISLTECAIECSTDSNANYAKLIRKCSNNLSTRSDCVFAAKTSKAKAKGLCLSKCALEKDKQELRSERLCSITSAFVLKGNDRDRQIMVNAIVKGSHPPKSVNDTDNGTCMYWTDDTNCTDPSINDIMKKASEKGTTKLFRKISLGGTLDINNDDTSCIFDFVKSKPVCSMEKAYFISGSFPGYEKSEVRSQLWAAGQKNLSPIEKRLLHERHSDHNDGNVTIIMTLDDIIYEKCVLPKISRIYQEAAKLGDINDETIELGGLVNLQNSSTREVLDNNKNLPSGTIRDLID
jgi:hypothetical protein